MYSYLAVSSGLSRASRYSFHQSDRFCFILGLISQRGSCDPELIGSKLFVIFAPLICPFSLFARLSFLNCVILYSLSKFVNLIIVL